MALPSAIKLFIDPKLGLAFGNFAGSSQISNPTFTLGDTAGIEIYLVESTQVASYPRQELPFPATPGIKVAIGAIDESPLAGTWVMSYGGNSTSALPYNATAAQLQTALNALASITSAGGVTVSKIGDNYNIAFNLPGVRTELTTDSTALIPLSTATVATLQEGTSTKVAITLVHLQRTVAGLATTFTQTSESQISIVSLGAWDGSKATYRLSISPDPKGGSFTIGFDALTGDDVSTSAIQVGASAQDVQNALNIKALVDKVTVTQVGAYAYDITVATQPGTSGLTANDAGLLSFNGYYGEISLNTAEAISLLDGAASVETTLEVEITSDSKTLTLLQIPCTLKNAVIDAGAVDPLVLDTYLSQTTADGRYLRQSNNLSDLGSTSTARTNLGVYSTSQVDTALALKANLSGAAFTGDVTTTGRMGIGGAVANNTAHKLAIYNGNVVFSAGYGLAFGDGTTQTTAATTPDLSGYATKSAPTFSDGVIINRNPAGTTLKLYDPTAPLYGTDLNNTNIIIKAGDAAEYGRMDSQAFTLYSGANSAGFSLSGFVINGAEPYARKSGATFTGKANFTSVSGAAGINIGIGGTSGSATTAGDMWIATGGASLNFRDGTGAWRVLAATSNTNTFSSPQIIDTTATTPGLRITQKGAGSALVVEDQTTPDSDALIVDANGNLGIGVSNNPGSIWSGTSYKLEVQGDALVQGTLRVPYQIDVGTVNDASMIVQSSISFPNYGGTLAGFTTQTNGVNTSGNVSFSDYPMEIVMKINGNLYAVPCRNIV
jgi:hypothetical protein